MNKFLKNTVILLVFVLLGCKATAQKFTTHKVKKGESLEQVSKRYNVSISDILIYNKEVKVGQDLTANSILVIPQGKASTKTTSTSNTNQMPTTFQKKENQEEPIGFISHKVKRKETLDGIAKRYNITEDDLKKYNRELYSTQLKKKMVLRIPKYKRIDPRDIKTAENPNDYETYIVAPKETRWSIAHKYGITVDSLAILNPILAKDSSYLAEGQELKVPKKAGSSLKNQETQLYVSYTVPAKENFYQLEKKFEVKSDEIVRLNPVITERGGLKEGMVIRIPQKKMDAGTVNTDNYIFYVVKPKQTEYNLTRKLGITYRELLKLNPELSDGLKAGMVLKLPKTQTGDFEVRNSLVLDKINLLDSINPAITPKLLFVLPFRLENMESKSDIERNIKRNYVNASLGLYSGALIAMDSLADLGISVDIKVLDNARSLSKTKELMASENIRRYSAVFGPLYASQLQEVSSRALQYQIPVVAPAKVVSKTSMPNVFFTYTPEKTQRHRIFSYIDSLAIEKNIIVIADSENDTIAKMIMQHFPDAKRAELIEEEKNISLRIDKFKELLSEEQENLVFVESVDYRLLASVTSILNASHNTPLDSNKSNKKVQLRMFTTNKNSAFDNDVISVSHLSNLNFTYPSVYREVPNNSFVKRYEKRFDNTPDRWAVRGFDITYDLLLKLAYKNNLIEVSGLIGETEYNGNKFSYKNESGSGYFNQAAYIMSYQDMRLKQLND